MSDCLSFHRAGSLLWQCTWTVCIWGSLLPVSDGEGFPPVCYLLSPRKKKIIAWRAVNLQIKLDVLLLLMYTFQMYTEVREGCGYVISF